MVETRWILQEVKNTVWQPIAFFTNAKDANDAKNGMEDADPTRQLRVVETM